jgi:hypothetical protein
MGIHSTGAGYYVIDPFSLHRGLSAPNMVPESAQCASCTHVMAHLQSGECPKKKVGGHQASTPPSNVQVVGTPPETAKSATDLSSRQRSCNTTTTACHHSPDPASRRQGGCVHSRSQTTLRHMTPPDADPGKRPQLHTASHQRASPRQHLRARRQGGRGAAKSAGKREALPKRQDADGNGRPINGGFPEWRPATCFAPSCQVLSACTTTHRYACESHVK